MADLAREVSNVIVMLNNYARHDEKTGQHEDAEYIRAAVDRLQEAAFAANLFDRRKHEVA